MESTEQDKVCKAGVMARPPEIFSTSNNANASRFTSNKYRITNISHSCENLWKSKSFGCDRMGNYEKTVRKPPFFHRFSMCFLWLSCHFAQSNVAHGSRFGLSWAWHTRPGTIVKTLCVLMIFDVLDMVWSRVWNGLEWFWSNCPFFSFSWPKSGRREECFRSTRYSIQ